MPQNPTDRELVKPPRPARVALGFVVRVTVMLAAYALTLVVVTEVLPGVHQLSFRAAFLVSAVVSVVSAFLWPLVIRFLPPFALIAFGLFSLFLTAAMVGLGFWVVDGVHPDFWSCVVIAIAFTLVSMAISPLLNVEGDVRNLRVVRLRVRSSRGANRTSVPGVIMFEIDGLGEGVLREAIAAGHVPTIARWLSDGSHRLQSWECDLSSQTGASQAGLLLGSNFDMPAFRWYEKETGRTLVSNHPGDAAEMEQRRASDRGLLANGGTSRGNMFSGGSDRCSATMSTIGNRQRSSPADLFAYFADPYALTRTLIRVVGDVLEERRAAKRQRKAGAEHVERGGLYPWMRSSITVAMRDVFTALLMADIVEGVRVSYATFVGYDEVAHHSGIREPDAFAVLKRHDAQLQRLERAVAQAPRPYHLVVLSDHGQTQGRPFRQRYGETLEAVVQRGLAQGDVFAPPAVDEAWGDLGAVLADASTDDSAQGRAVARATRNRSVGGTVALGPNRDALEERGAGPDAGDAAVVLPSGGLGLVYLPIGKERLTLEQISAAHPQLIPTLAEHPGVGFVMVRSAEHGPVALGAGGMRRLSDDHVEGVDPLLNFDSTAAAHLRRTDSFPHCPDILVNAMYDPVTGETAPFEDFMGSHGGLGGPQTHPFAVLPADWPEPAQPIVGVEQMHDALSAWIGAAQALPQPATELTVAPPPQ